MSRPEAAAQERASRLALVREITGVQAPFHAVLLNGDVYCTEFERGVIKKIGPDGVQQWLGALDEHDISSTWQSAVRQPAGVSPLLRQPHTIKRRGQQLEISLLGSNDIVIVDAQGLESRLHYEHILGAGLVTVAHAEDGRIVAIDYRRSVIQRREGASPVGRIDFLGCPADPSATPGWQAEVRFIEDSTDHGFILPHEVLIRGEYLYVADTGNHRIKRYGVRSGVFAGWIGEAADGRIMTGWAGRGEARASAVPGGFDEPVSMAFDERGRLFVLNHGDGRVQMFDAQGEPQATFDLGGRLKLPYGLAIDEGMLVIANTGCDEILVYEVMAA